MVEPQPHFAFRNDGLIGRSVYAADTEFAGNEPSKPPVIVSLFSGAGGLDLGFKQEGFKIGIAFDAASAAINTYRRNFPKSAAVLSDLRRLGPSGVVDHVKSAIPAGSRIGIIGGPPCQGFSRANVRATESDPRNDLPKLYINIIRALQRLYRVEFVVFENVLGMRDVKHAEKYNKLVRSLHQLKFHVCEQELCALEYGVPQTRRRIVLAGIAGSTSTPSLKIRRRGGAKSVRDAIGKLPPPAFFARDLLAENIPVHPNHWTMNPVSRKFKNRGMKSGDTRSFKRLVWEKPSPTIAFGHREIHVHPSGRRRISIFEAMLLQGFPSTFVLDGNLSEQVEQVSNAVPPPLARSIASAVRRALAKKAVK